jgi:hypothetical protein
MKRIALIVSLLITLNGCCLLECVGPLDRTGAPYGAHFYKEGMTRESRMEDLMACGSARSLHIGFAKEKIKQVLQNPEILKQLEPEVVKYTIKTREQAQETEAEAYLLGQLDVCMAAKDYIFIARGQALSGCDARCMYP